MTRRELLRWMTLWSVAPLVRRPPHRSPEPLRLGVMLDSPTAPGSSGASLGAEEAIRTAALFDQRVAVATRHGVPDVGDAFRGLIDENVSVIVSLLSSAGQFIAATEGIASAPVVLLNAGSSADVLRAERCAPNLFHVAPSDRMLTNARVHGADDPGKRVVTWHATLERYGAGQLNERFHSRFTGAMTGEDWQAWMAVKIALEAFLRSRSNEAAHIRAYLERGGTQFDGHKGMPLAFRAEDHQLLQPLYCVTGDEVVQVPPPSGGNERSALDALGGANPGPRCG